MQANLIQHHSAKWLSHPFYKESVVLGVDIGIEGIGICLRKGPEILVNKTLLFDLPQAEALADRRAKRAWRHCRKNRKTRMHRLRKLFTKHGLTWPTEEVLSRTDPFVLRHRAITSRLASDIALAIAIRHLVLHRGYDFHANSEGEFPWGEDASLAEARKWLEASHINQEIADYLWEIEPSLATKASASGKELTGSALEKEEAEREAFRQDVRKRLQDCESMNIATLLEKYRREKKPRFRSAMRRRNLPRRLIEDHLREIINRHANLITDVDGFTSALFLKPDPAASPLLQKRAREHAIFHYNRKTQAEAKAIWQRKTKDCTLAAALGLPPAKAGDAKDEDIRRWRILEFAATRRVEIAVTTGKGAEKSERVSAVRLPASAVEALVASVPDKTAKWAGLKKLVTTSITAANPGAKVVPETRSSFNKSFFTQLHDLALPTAANARKKATVAPATAAHLVQVAIADNSDFSPQGINERLNAIDFYNRRRLGNSSGPLHPQVRFLLGQRARDTGAAPHWAVEGKLQRIFSEAAVASRMDGRTAPDYMIIECIGDPPRNQAQKRELEQDQKDRRKTRDELFEKYSVGDSGVASRRRRILLHDQQRGLCPFTGLELGNPLSQDLELEHLFPQSRGGLSTDANLVLTFRWVNALKGNHTPREFAAHRTDARILGWNAMLEVTRNFKWSARKDASQQPHRKRDLFQFDGDGFPDFGNTTFTAQLARQLVHEAAIWMGVKDDPEEIRKRIATPSGWLAAKARRTWIMDEDGSPLLKDRGQPQHHLVDALVLSHIPPAEGMNSVACGGIFWSDWQTVERDRVRSYRAITRALPSLLPPQVISNHLRPLLGSAPEVLPVEKHRPRRKWATSLGDSTFWRVDFRNGKTYQRKALKRTDKEFTGAEALHATLTLTRIPEKLIPSHRELERWLNLPDDDPAELCLTDGTPVRNVWKPCGKGTLSAPLGWTATPGKDGKPPKRFMNLSVKSEALEIWVAWNGKKWAFIKRRAPEKTALRHLRRFAGPLDQIAPVWMQEKPDKPETHKTLEQIVCGNVLPAGARKIATIKKGDCFRVSFTPDGKIHSYSYGLPSTWVEVSAVKGNLSIKVKPILALPETLGEQKRDEWVLSSVPDLLALAGYPTDAPSAADTAGLSAPCNDPSPDIGGRSRTRNPLPAGQTDLWEA